jgi:5'-methylthioadenosine phosphorylase
VLAVFQSNAAKIRQVVLDLIGKIPANLDEVSTVQSLEFTRGDGHAASASDIRLFEQF